MGGARDYSWVCGTETGELVPWAVLGLLSTEER